MNSSKIPDEITIEKLGPGNACHWDDVYHLASNAHLMAHRSFFTYHSDRFTDHSLLFRRRNRFLAILPANRDDDILYSHQGISFAGLIMAKRTRLQDVRDIFSSLRDHLHAEGFSRLVYRPAPFPYHAHPREDDLFCLHDFGAFISDTKCHAMMQCQPGPVGNEGILRRVSRALGSGITIHRSGDLDEFWPQVERLLGAHGARPVHSLEEIRLLRARLPNEVILFSARSSGGEFLAGQLLLLSPSAITGLYLGETPAGRVASAGILIMNHMITCPEHEGLWFDLGQWTDTTTREPSDSLLRFKESFGARTILRHTWRLDIDSPQSHG